MHFLSIVLFFPKKGGGTLPVIVNNHLEMNSVKEAYSRVMCSDGWPTSINSMNSSVKLWAAKEIYTSSHRRGGEDKLCWSLSSLLTVTNSLIHGIFLARLSNVSCCQLTNQPRYSQNRPKSCRIQSPNQAPFNKNLKRRLFMNHCLWSNRRAFSLEACFSSPALWFCIKNSSRTPLCFSPYNSLVPAQTGSGGHCLEKIASPLNSVVRVWKWMFPYHEILPCIVILHHHMNQPCGNVLTNQGSSVWSNNCMFVTSSQVCFSFHFCHVAQGQTT